MALKSEPGWFLSEKTIEVLASLAGSDRLGRDHQEAGEVGRVVFDRLRQDLHAVQLGGPARGHRGLGRVALVADDLHAAGGIVGGFDLDPFHPAQGAVALGQRLGMADHPAQACQGGAGQAHQAVVDGQVVLAGDPEAGTGSAGRSCGGCCPPASFRSGSSPHGCSLRP